MRTEQYEHRNSPTMLQSFQEPHVFLLTQLHLLNYAGLYIGALNEELRKSVHSQESSVLSTDAASKETRQMREKVT